MLIRVFVRPTADWQLWRAAEQNVLTAQAAARPVEYSKFY